MEPITYLDVCSGYSAFTQGAVGLGFDCLGYAEVDAFPSALLGHHYGASRARYMPDPDADDLDLKEKDSRIALAKAMRSLPDNQFGNTVINFGDFSQIREDDVRGPVHLLTGGTPCQAFSMAGKRLGLDDPRGNLTLEFLALAKRVRAEWLLWENVAGFLSHDGGRTAGTFFGLLGELGYGWAYRVLDAQFIRVDGHERAVPQRRRRVFVVAHLGDTAGPAAVLFDRESLRGDPAPRRRTGQDVAGAVAPCLVSSGRGVERTGDTRGQDPVVAVAFGGGNAGAIDIATTRSAHGGPHGGPHGRLDFESETFVAQPIAFDARQSDVCIYGDITGPMDTQFPGPSIAHALTANGFDASEDGTGRGTPLVPVAFSVRGRDGEPQAEPAAEGLAPSLRTTGGGSSHAFVAHAIQAGALRENPNSGPDGVGVQADIAYTLEARAEVQAVQHEWAVRRLTPRECERLMAVPDDFTLIQYRGKPAADGPRYKALGNSQAVNNMRWLARGIRDVIDIQRNAR